MKLTREQQQALLHIVEETLWMARRYADGRSTYAVQQYNDCVHLLDRVGLEHLLRGDPAYNGSRFANDGMFGTYNPSTRKYSLPESTDTQV